jgi:hypothetical protein
MSNTKPTKPFRRWPVFVLLGTVGIGGFIAYHRIESAIRAQLPVVLKAKLEAALQRPVQFGALHVTPLGIWVDDFRVGRVAGEKVDLVSAKRLVVSADWWQLVTSREMKVGGVELDRADVRITPDPKKKEPLPRQLQKLATSGVQRFGLRESSIHMMAPASDQATWKAEGVGGDLIVPVQANEQRGYEYTAKLAQFDGGGVSLSKIAVAGDGNEGKISLASATADYQGGHVQASGSLDGEADEVLMRLRGEEVPLSKLAPYLGIPNEWAVQGSVTGDVQVDARNNSLQSLKGTVHVHRGSVARNGGRLPWQFAQADVTWSPRGTSLRNVKVSGEGLLLTAAGSVATVPGRPFTDGTFKASGEVSADKPEAVKRLGELLAGPQFLNGRWEAATATVGFGAEGTVGDLSQATASGHVDVASLKFRPMENSQPVLVKRLQAEMRQAPSEPTVYSISAETDRLNLNGDVVMTSDRNGTPGQSIQVRNMVLQPTRPGEKATRVQLDGRLEREAHKLMLRDLIAKADGFTLSGDASLTDDEPGKPGEFWVDGKLVAEDLNALQRVTSSADVWQLIHVNSSASKGSLEFQVRGPRSDPSALEAKGAFIVDGFRLSAHSPLPSGAVFYIPVKRATGRFEQADRQMAVRDLHLEARTFLADGTMDFGLGEKPSVKAALDIVTEDWRSLPAMPVGALPELNGGHFTATLKLAAPLDQIERAPVDGKFLLTDARYSPGRDGVDPVSVQAFGADFHWAENVLQLHEVRVQTPILSGNAKGRIYPAPSSPKDNPRFRVALDVHGETGDAGLLAKRFTDDLTLTGGTASADFKVDAPVEKVDEGDLSGLLHLRTDEIRAADGEDLAVVGLDVVKKADVEVRFTRSMEKWDITRLALKAPGMSLTMYGKLSPETIDAQVALTTDRWTAPKDVPVTGGVLSVQGKIAGDPSKPETLAFDGGANLDTAQLRYKSSTAAVTGGALTLSVTGHGPIEGGIKWLDEGQVKLAGAAVEVKGLPIKKIDTVTGAVGRQGEALVVKAAELHAAGIVATGGGTWSSEKHEFVVMADAPDLSTLGFAIPEGIGARRVRVSGKIAGTEDVPVATAEGRVELDGVSLELAGIRKQQFSKMAGDFQYSQKQLRLEKFEGAGEGGTLTASGEWTKAGYKLQVHAAGDDFNRLGYELSNGFGIGAFEIDGEFSGSGKSAKDEVIRGAGKFSLTNARFPFGQKTADGKVPSHSFRTLTSRFELDGDVVKLSDLEGRGPAGHVTGSATIGKGQYSLALTVPVCNTEVARWLVPGNMAGGELSGSVNLEGKYDSEKGDDAVTLAYGRFDLKGATYTLPADLQLRKTPIALPRFAGNYRWEGDRTLLDNILIDGGDLLQATGTLTVLDDGKGQVKADVTSRNMGAVADFWPALEGWLRGGAGTGKLETTFDSKGASGTIMVKSEGGTLLLREAEGDFAEQPITTASVLLGFSPSKLTFTDVQVRGPKSNLDGNGEWGIDGPVSDLEAHQAERLGLAREAGRHPRDQERLRAQRYLRPRDAEGRRHEELPLEVHEGSRSEGAPGRRRGQAPILRRRRGHHPAGEGDLCE